MRLKPMRYKDYTWPHNPETYTVEYRRQVAAHKVPLGGWCLQDLGRTHRILRGEGTFAGEGAYEEFQELAAVFLEEGPGLLVHPVWRTVSAHFVTLELLEKPLPDYVRYSFAFWEDGGTGAALTELPAETVGGSSAVSTASGGETGSGRVCVVRKGDTLWGIAGTYGVALTELIRANPQIKNPNLIYPGDRVTLP